MTQQERANAFVYGMNVLVCSECGGDVLASRARDELEAVCNETGVDVTKVMEFFRETESYSQAIYLAANMNDAQYMERFGKDNN